MSDPNLNEAVMDVCDACGGDGEFIDPCIGHGEPAPCGWCRGTGYVLRMADACDFDDVERVTVLDDGAKP